MAVAPRHPTFIGRTDELARLRTLLDEAHRGRPRVALISGAAGMGKTSLVERLLAAVAGARVVVGECLPLSAPGIPFSPWEALLQSLGVEPEDAAGPGGGGVDLRRWTGDDRGDAAGARMSQFRTILEAVERSAASATTVLVIEDVHWSDRTTRDVLTYLLANLRDQRCLLVLTCRTDGVARDSPVRSWLAEMSTRPVVESLVLEGFRPSQVAAQIEALTGTPASTATVRLLATRTNGNPYFVGELVAGGFLDGRELPATLRDLLLARAEVVSSATLRTLRILSLAEDQISDAALARIAALPISQLHEAVREAVDARLLVATPNGVRFAHALMREALADDLLPGERKGYHGAIAEVLASQTADGPLERARVLAQLAHHCHRAGDTAGAADAWVRAAAAAEEVYAFAEAHDHLIQLLGDWETASRHPLLNGVVRRDLLARAAENAFLGGDPDTAVTLAREAIALTDLGREPARAGVLKERLARYLRDTTDHATALDESLAALALVPDRPISVERARVLAGAAGQQMVNGRHQEALELAAAAAEMARRVGAPAVEADALNTLGCVTASQRDVAAGLGLIERALALAARCGDAHQQMRSHWNTFCVLFESAEWEPALEAFRRADDEIARLGHGHLQPELAGFAVEVLWRLGRWQEAQAVLDDVRRRPTATDRVATNIELLVGLGRFEEASGEIDAAASRNVFNYLEGQAWLSVARATVDVWEGSYDTARTAVDAALAHLEELDAPLAIASAVAVGLRCEADAAVSARRRGDHAEQDRAARRADSLSAAMGRLMSRSAPANGWKREAGALAVQCDAERARAHGVDDPDRWMDAVRAWDALAMPYHAAYARLQTAEALVAGSSDRDAAARLVREALETARSLGAVPLTQQAETLARRRRLDVEPAAGSGAHLGLTAREVEVLRVLACGATNRQIASTLFISEKTASVHVSNIIRKLNVSNRSEAAATAVRAGLA